MSDLTRMGLRYAWGFGRDGSYVTCRRCAQHGEINAMMRHVCAPWRYFIERGSREAAQRVVDITAPLSEQCEAISCFFAEEAERQRKIEAHGDEPDDDVTPSPPAATPPEHLLGVVSQVDRIATDGVMQRDDEQSAGERATGHAEAYRPGRATVAEKPNAPVSRGVQPTE